MLSAFTLLVRDITDTPRQQTLALPKRWFEDLTEGTVETASDDLNVAVEAHHVGDGILLRGELDFTINLRCSRCVEHFPVVVKQPLCALFHRDTKAFQADDAYVYRGERLDLQDVIRDQLLLTLPMQPRCERTSCKTAATPQHSANKDGRLASLGDLINHSASLQE